MTWLIFAPGVRVRLLVIAVLTLLSGWIISARGITLGLDLQGGTRLTLMLRDLDDALTAAQREDAVDRALRVIRSRVDELGIVEPGIQKGGTDRILVELPGVTGEQQQRAKEVITRAAFLQFQIVGPMAELQEALPRMDRAVATMAAQLDPPGAAAPDTSATMAPDLGLFGTPAAPDARAVASPDTARGQPGEPEPPSAPAGLAAAQTFSDRLLPAGVGDEAIFLVADDDASRIDRYLEFPEVRQALPRGLELRWGAPEEGIAQGYRKLYALEAGALITGEHLVDAQAQRDPQLGQPIVAFEFSRRGGRIFEQGTAQNVGRLMAIVLDDRVVNAPVIEEPIGSQGRILLSGGSIVEARDLALVLRAGALPAPMNIVEERSVGASLGQDSIDRGRLAGIIGLGLVVLIVLLYYRLSGALAVAALALYILFVLSGMAALGRTLTLPGIAGLILSIGMAVDANVLIFERIREELAAGRTPRMAVNEGFKQALSAIVDAQVTTMLTALVLFQLGTGPVRGFAVTLAIGIVASMFTAIYVTRTFFTLYVERRAGVRQMSI